MTPEQSKDLKIGTRVCFNGVRSDGGTVTASQARYLTINGTTAMKALQATMK